MSGLGGPHHGGYTLHLCLFIHLGVPEPGNWRLQRAGVLYKTPFEFFVKWEGEWEMIKVIWYF